MVTAVRVLAISGSLSATSSNSALVAAAAASTVGVEVRLWDELGRLPFFSPEAEPNEHVDSLRAAIADSDAVWIATPEYAGAMPGGLKNALDWLVGSGELYGKRVVIVSAAPSRERGHNARRSVAEVLAMQGALVADSFTVAIAASDTPEDVAAKAADALTRVVGALGH